MKIQEKAVRLSIKLSETEKLDGKALYEVIVLKARDLGIASASVYRGIMGYDTHWQIHSVKLLRLSEDLPIMIELIDTEESIAVIRTFLESVLQTGIVTEEKITITKYSRHDR
ncbi:MAG: DUF190 domain-containing protein [Nitrospira sp.]|nr:DUF190 domain-containing protein [bacterium]MBL7050060.1 DUF190 domain-containing protein [Nitrospira sp.]